MTLLFRRAPEPQTVEVDFDTATYAVRVRRHAQARRYTLRIQAATGEAVLTIPPRGSLREAQAFAQKNGGWIAARLGRVPQGVPFVPGASLPLRGETHEIAHRPRQRGTVWPETATGGERLLCVSGDLPHVERRVGDFLVREAKRDLDAATRAYAERLAVCYSRISVRDQTSRWGSCSVTGVLSYSWRLVLAPPFVLDYLAAHEVAHLVEMNHSHRFWRLVLRICPHAHRAKVWLDVNGTDLYRYGRADRESAAAR